MHEDLGRLLTSANTRRFLFAIQQEMGHSGLITVLQHANLPRYAAALPPDNQVMALHAAEYAALTQAIENYFGRGARGTLNRMGRTMFSALLREQKFQAFYRQLAFRFMAPLARKEMALKWLAQEMAAPAGRVTVHLDDQNFILVDHMSDATFGRTREQAICWATSGAIQATMLWSTGVEHQVSEIDCKAKGNAACRFEIGSAFS